MPELITSDAVFRHARVSVHDVRCRSGRCGCTGEEQNRSDTIVFVRSGVFIKHVRGEKIVGDPATALFFTRGETYRVSHPGHDGDHCTSFAVAPSLLWEALAEFDPGAAERRDGLFPLTHAPA